MRSVRGVIGAVQEGRFRLITDEGRVMPFVLSHRSAAEPQDLPPLQARAARVRVEYGDSPHLIAAIAESIEVEE
jgi:hypothetical protein